VVVVVVATLLVLAELLVVALAETVMAQMGLPERQTLAVVVAVVDREILLGVTVVLVLSFSLCLYRHP